MGRFAAHIKNIKTDPEIVPIFIPIPKRSANPISSSASINNQSVIPLPPMTLKIDLKGPVEPCVKKPTVGDPPEIHPLPGCIENPNLNI